MTGLVETAARMLGARVAAVAPLAGGDLSAVFRLTLADGGRVIAKQGVTATAEAAMLRAIAATGAPAPAVIAVSDALLLMEDVAAGEGLAAAWGDLARALGLLHAATGPNYGWDRDHAFGPLPISNGPMDHWPTFWAERRLLCHVPFVLPDRARRIERLAGRLGDILPGHPPAALLHGDLWGGNVLVANGRVAALIDPACYFGDCEVDAAMLTIFERPPPDFIDALSLAPGWRERQPVYRLWPLLVHLRLLGESYGSAVDQALSVASDQ